MPRIIVEVQFEPRWLSGSVSVELNGRVLGMAGPNAREEYVVEAGSHTLQVRKGNASSQLVRFRADENDVLDFRCAVSGYLRKSLNLQAVFRKPVSQRLDHHGSAYQDRRRHDILPGEAKADHLPDDSDPSI
jgi:hypothetical protein